MVSILAPSCSRRRSVRLHRPLDHHPVDRHADIGAFEIDARAVERRLPLLDRRLGVTTFALAMASSAGAAPMAGVAAIQFGLCAQRPSGPVRRHGGDRARPCADWRPRAGRSPLARPTLALAIASPASSSRTLRREGGGLDAREHLAFLHLGGGVDIARRYCRRAASRSPPCRVRAPCPRSRRRGARRRAWRRRFGCRGGRRGPVGATGNRRRHPRRRPRREMSSQPFFMSTLKAQPIAQNGAEVSVTKRQSWGGETKRNKRAAAV